ncbi:MAG: hypothetical protein K9K64_09905 [Desulfohalobiaceae bacterium]|nr:hypothetical protein [Desulfohalobiaceae bacterium]
MSHHIGHHPVARRIVQDLAHHGAGLAEVVVVFAQGLGGEAELTASPLAFTLT